MLWSAVVTERLAVAAEALIRMDNATLVWGLRKRVAPAGLTKAGTLLAGGDEGAAHNNECRATPK